MEILLNFQQLLNTLFCLKNNRYFYVIKKNWHCFTGNLEFDIFNANKVVDGIKSNNTAHVACAAFIYAFNKFYGMRFNPKYINPRPHEVSKFTTRLTQKDIELARTKILDWIKDANNIKNNTKQYIKLTRIRFFYLFEALLYTGMRAGELASIDFKSIHLNRFVSSDISHDKYAELIINTEKTCKKREVYLPENVYKFFLQDNKKLDIDYISHIFVAFRKWAKLPFKLTSHALRRTKATIMHEYGADISTIAMVLGNTPEVVKRNYILSSQRNFEACDIANCYVSGDVIKKSNVYWDNNWLKKITISKGEDYEKRK